MICPIKLITLYDLKQNKDDEGYLNPSYTLNTTFKADVQILGGEKALAEYGITDSKIGFALYPTMPQTLFSDSAIYEKIVKITDIGPSEYYQIMFSDFEGYKMVVKPMRETVVIEVVS